MLARPTSRSDLHELLITEKCRWRIRGTDTKTVFARPMPSETHVLDASSFNGVLAFEPADQTVTVLCGTKVNDLQQELASKGHCLPLPQTGHFLIDGMPGTVGGMLASALPHGLEFQTGPVRDWLLQLEVWTPGGFAFSGAKVVKSVAGYDVHKALVGSQGLYGPMIQATLKTWPKKNLIEPSCDIKDAWDGRPFWISRTLRSGFKAALERAQGVIASDSSSCTIWSYSEPDRPKDGWVIGPGGELWSENRPASLLARAKAVFDPEGVWT